MVLTIYNIFTTGAPVRPCRFRRMNKVSELIFEVDDYIAKCIDDRSWPRRAAVCMLPSFTQVQDVTAWAIQFFNQDDATGKIELDAFGPRWTVEIYEIDKRARWQCRLWARCRLPLQNAQRSQCIISLRFERMC